MDRHPVDRSDQGWVVVVPVKELGLAKTRLRHLSAQVRADLALAMAADVIAAALATPSVVGVVVVTNDLRAADVAATLGAQVVADATDSGIDDALRSGARFATTLWPRCGVAAVSSDLPCATAEALEVILRRAARASRAVLADRGGDGTTVLTARAGDDLTPSYGPASRARHVVAGAAQLDPSGAEALTIDVDTAADLAAALAQGVGPRTAAVMLRADTG